MKHTGSLPASWQAGTGPLHCAPCATQTQFWMKSRGFLGRTAGPSSQDRITVWRGIIGAEKHCCPWGICAGPGKAVTPCLTGGWGHTSGDHVKTMSGRTSFSSSLQGNYHPLPVLRKKIWGEHTQEVLECQTLVQWSCPAREGEARAGQQGQGAAAPAWVGV